MTRGVFAATAVMRRQRRLISAWHAILYLSPRPRFARSQSAASAAGALLRLCKVVACAKRCTARTAARSATTVTISSVKAATASNSASCVWCSATMICAVRLMSFNSSRSDPALSAVTGANTIISGRMTLVCWFILLQARAASETRTTEAARATKDKGYSRSTKKTEFIALCRLVWRSVH